MKNLRLCLLALIALSLVLGACGDSNQPAGNAASTTGSNSSSSTAQGNSSNPVKINWWHIQTTEPGKSVWQQMANAYMKAHPNVSIEITILDNELFKTKLQIAMAAGNTPDLFQSWGGGALQTYAKAGNLKDITGQLQGDWGNSFSKPVLDQYSLDGKYYGVPWDIGMVGFWYNKALFQKAGITDTPKTWADFLEAVKKLKAAGITPIALGGKEGWTEAFYWEYLATRIGGQEAFLNAYNRTGSFTDPTFVKAGQTLQQLVALEPFSSDYLKLSYNEQAAMMGNGQAAMELMGQWGPALEKDNSTSKQGIGSNLGFFPFPLVEGGVGQATDVLGGGNGFIVGKKAPAETVDFLRYLTNIENQRILATNGLALPPVKGAEDAITDPLLKQVNSQVSNAKYFQLYYDQFMPPEVGTVINDATKQLFAGIITSEKVAEMIAKSYSK